MKKRFGPVWTASGASLIEIILALVITALVLGIIYGALRFSHRALDKGEARMDRSQHLRTLVDRIVPIIRSAYAYVKKSEEGNQLFFIGESDEIGLITTDVDLYREDIANRAGMKWVRIFVDRDGLQMRETYFFNPDVLDDDEAGEVIAIDPNVKDIKFEYLEIKEDETQGTWTDEWEPDDERPQLPRAIRVSLKVMDQGEELTIPPFVVRIPAFAPTN